MFRWPDDVPELSDGRVRLRAHRDADLDAIVEMCRDPLTQRWAANLPDPYGPTDAESFLRERVAPAWASGTARGWAVEAVDTDGMPRYAGNIDLRGGPAGSIGFVLHPWARARGVMSRAVRLALTWGFTHGGLESVTWLAQVGNVASRRVAWATGFTFHGTLPRQLGPQLGRGPLSDAWLAVVVSGDELRPRTRWLTAAVLRGERVVLRPHTTADIPRIVEACSDARTTHWLSTMPSPYTEDSARTYLDSMPAAESVAHRVAWCIAHPETDALLANLSIFDLGGDDPGSGELGYWTHPDARGRGAMTEAVRLVVEHALTSTADGGLGLRRLTLLAAAGNAASAHIARRAGFTEVGRERQAELLGDGSYDDLLTFDVLLSDDRPGHTPGRT
ncbi:MAG: GNAT family N-acetyltransferase [Actinomycetota bacterium]|nr:GNAT family N-acetyltransferase [Actinomycetota bacterium]